MIWLLREKQTKNKNLEKTKETIFDKSWKSEMQNQKKKLEKNKNTKNTQNTNIPKVLQK